MRWIKKGLLIKPDPSNTWSASHAVLAALAPISSQERIRRIYFSSRDVENRSRVAWAEVVFAPEAKVLRRASSPVMDLGEPGRFDESGVSVSCLVPQRDSLYLYYTGWSLPRHVAFQLSVGLAISRDGGHTFERWKPDPLLDPTSQDPHGTASPSILIENGLWRMWYVSFVGWVDPKTPRYHIKYAESSDGLVWKRSGIIAIDFASPAEYALGRPCVIKEGSLYRMWFCSRGSAYRIHYAESYDGLRWSRSPVTELDVSPQGWDSQMTAYPCVFVQAGRWHMLYNGNGYGRDGIGWAVGKP